MPGATWFFGYGSLIWRPFEPHVEACHGVITGWSRRFWQGSPDHRGTPEAPGRVVTLIPTPGVRCDGLCFKVAEAHVPEAFAVLDHREQAGYARHRISVALADGRVVPDAVMYVATADNPDYLGEARLLAIAEHVVSARGPSGTNVGYVASLAAALEALGADDAHVREVWRLAQELTKRTT